jgi:hypothetical protein
MEHITWNLSARNSRELAARKNIRKPTTTLVALVKLTQEFILQACKPGSSVLQLQFTSVTLQNFPSMVAPAPSSLSFFVLYSHGQT